MNLLSLRGAITLNGIVWCVAILSVIQNVRLADRAKADHDIAFPPPLEPGNQLRKLVAFDPDGQRLELDFKSQKPGQHVLIITMSPNCPICLANEHSWKSLASALKDRPDWRVVWFSRDPVIVTKKYFRENGLGSKDVFAEPTNLTYHVLRLYAVPNTIAVDDRGVVQKIWGGLLTPEKSREISQDLSIPQELQPAP